MPNVGKHLISRYNSQFIMKSSEMPIFLKLTIIVLFVNLNLYFMGSLDEYLNVTDLIGIIAIGGFILIVLFAFFERQIRSFYSEDLLPNVEKQPNTTD